MFIKNETIQLFGKPLFSWVEIKTPTTVHGLMPEDQACFTYILKGENASYSESEMVKLNNKHAVLSKCGTYISKMTSRTKEAVFSSITVHFHKDVLKRIYEHETSNFFAHKKQIVYNQLQVSVTGIIENYFNGIKLLFETPNFRAEQLLILKLKEIIWILLYSDDSELISDLMSNLFDKKTHHIKDIIETHICSDLSLNELALLTNMSLSTFKRKFKKIYNDTPSSYLTNRRLEKMKEQLLASDDTIQGIAYDCGFKSVSHLNRLFKEKYGVTPKQFRMNH